MTENTAGLVEAAVKRAQQKVLVRDAARILVDMRKAGKTEEELPCPGSKIRSKGKGRGLGIGRGRGPIGVPIGQKLDLDIEKLPEALQIQAYKVKAKKKKEKKEEKKEKEEKAAALASAVQILTGTKEAARKLTPGSLKGGPSEPAAKAPAGEGARFKALKKKISRRGGVRDPGAVAAAIGRAKFGKGKFQAMAAKGRKAASPERQEIVKSAAFALMAVKHGTEMEKQAAIRELLQRVLPALARGGGRALKAVGGKYGLHGLARGARRLGLREVASTLGRSAKSLRRAGGTVRWLAGGSPAMGTQAIGEALAGAGQRLGRSILASPWTFPVATGLAVAGGRELGSRIAKRRAEFARQIGEEVRKSMSSPSAALPA